MIKYLFLTVMLLSSMFVFAQTDTSSTTKLNTTVLKADTSAPEPPDYKMVKFKPAFMFGFNSYGKFADSVLYNTNSSSRTASIGGHVKLRFSQESKWYFKTGLELGWNNYMLADTAARIRKNDSLGVTEFYQDTVNWRKSKYMRTMITIPLFLEFNSSTHPKGKKDGFKFGFGPYIGFRIASYEVAKRSTSFQEQESGADAKITIREGNDLNLGGMNFGVMGMLGAEEFNLFVRYDLTKVFKADKGPELSTFSWGVIFQ